MPQWLERAQDLRSAAIQNAPPGVLFWALRNGAVRRGMPSQARLPDQQIWQLVTYLKTLGEAALGVRQGARNNDDNRPLLGPQRRGLS